MSTVSKADSPGGSRSPRLAPAAAARVGALLAEPDAPPVAPGGARTLGILAVLLVAGLHAAGLAGSLGASAGVAQALSGSAREESSMGQSRKFGAMAGAVALSFASVAAAQDAVQWRVEDGGNGHWYQGVIVSKSGASWSQARAHAQSTGGDLSKVYSPAHLAWLFDQIVGSASLWSQFAGPWVGAWQAPQAAEPAGGWTWVDGSPIEPEVWSAGQPDDAINCGGNNNRMAFWNGATGVPQPFLEDSPDDQSFTPCVGSRISCVIEWSADCNGDGIVDFGQIRDGSLDDANGNNIPDCCESNLPCNCPGDIVRDGLVNGIDLAAVLNNWGATGGGAIDADVNDDGIVNGADLSIVLGTWGPCE